MKLFSSFLLSILLFISAACSIDSQETNLLKNGDFSESITNDWWTSRGPDNSYTTSISDLDYSSPNYSAFIRCDSVSNSFSLWGQKISGDLPTGSRLKLSLKIKLDSVEGNGVGYAVRFDNTETPEGEAEKFTTSQGIMQISGDADWKEYELTTEEISDEIKSVTVYLMMFDGTTGTAYFDDVVLKKSTD
jgi:hypothetical protein